MHEVEFGGIGTTREIGRLQPPDAMFGADAAAQALDQVEHGKLQRRSAREETLGVAVWLLAHVEMQVAVARVAVRDDISFGNQAVRQRGSRLDERWNGRHGYREVVFEARAVAALRLRHRLAQF